VKNKEKLDLLRAKREEAKLSGGLDRIKKNIRVENLQLGKDWISY